MTEKINLFTILHADKKELISICRALKLSTHGSERQLQERIIRHIFPVESGGDKEPEFIGTLNINTARVDQFLLWPYIGKTTVDNIMEYRQKYGRFQSVEELLNVKGIGIKTFGILRKFLTTKGQTTLRIRRGGEEEVEELMKIKEIEVSIRKREHVLQDREEAVESDHEEIEEQQEEIQRSQEELDAKEMAILEKEKEIEELKGQLSQKEEKIETHRKEIESHRKDIEGKAKEIQSKEKKIKELKDRVEKTYGAIDVGKLVPRVKVQEMVGEFKKHEEDMTQSYKKLLSDYNNTKEELVCLIGENQDLHESMELVMKKQGQLTGALDQLKTVYEENFQEQKELEKRTKKLKRQEDKIFKENEKLKVRGLRVREQLQTFKTEKREMEKERNALLRKIHSEQGKLNRERTQQESLQETYERKLSLTGTINVNKAGKEELLLWPQFTLKVVDGLINYRKKFGSFKRLDELKQVDGIGGETYKLLLPFVRLSGESGLRIQEGAKVTKAVEDFLRQENDIVQKKKDLIAKHDSLDAKFTQRREELEHSSTALEEKLKTDYSRMSEALTTKVMEREETLVTEFMERHGSLEKKFETKFSELHQEQELFRAEKEQLTQSFTDREKEQNELEGRLRLEKEVLEKGLVLQGWLNINKAGKKELLLWPSITPKLAENIVKFRKKSGKFTDPANLLQVPGIGRETYKTLAPFITLTGPSGIQFCRKDEVRTVFQNMEEEKVGLENMQKSLMERRDALNELYEEKEQEELRFKELQREYGERKRAIDEVYEERLKLKEKAELEHNEYIRKKEQLDAVYQERLVDMETGFREKEKKLRALLKEKEAEFRENFSEQATELATEFQEKENYYQYRLEEMQKRDHKIAEREEIHERGAILSGRINLNKATREELLLWPHIPLATAQNIIAYQKKYGFTDVDQLKEVKGIGEESFQILRPFVDVKGPTGLRINEGFNPETIIDDLEEQKKGMSQQKHDYHVRKRELEWEYQERFGATEKHLKQYDKELKAEKTGFEEDMKEQRDLFDQHMDDEGTRLNTRDASLKGMNADLKRYDQKLKRRGVFLDKLDDTLEEREIVLAKNATLFGRLNINRAPREELMLWPHINEKLADEIIAYRTKRRFRRVEELKEIKGIGDEVFHEMRPFLVTSGKTGLRISSGEEVYTVLDDLELRRDEMLEARTGFHRQQRELRDEYHEKVEVGLRDISKGEKTLRKKQRALKKTEKDTAVTLKELEQREKKLREEEEIAAMNAVLLGNINLNTVTRDELIYWPHISEKTADNIIEYRENYGNFNKVEEFKQVKGIGDETYKLLRPFVTLAGRTGLTINLHDRKTEELRTVEENIQKSAEHFQKRSGELQANLLDLASIRDSVEEDKDKMKKNIHEIEDLKGKVSERYQHMEDLKKKMEDMHGTMGQLLTGGELEGISVRSLLPKEELEAFEQDKEDLKEKVDGLNDLQEQLEEEREQLGFASKFRVTIPLEIEVGDDPIGDDKIIVTEEKGDFHKEIPLARHGKRIGNNLYSVVLPEIPAGRKYTILHDNGEGKRYIIVKNYSAKVVEE